MNVRQKKKQFKKRHGHNPIKGADGRYIFKAWYEMDLSEEQCCTKKLTPEQVKMICEISPEMVENIRNTLLNAGAIAAQAIADFGEAVNKTFSGLAAQYRQSTIEQEDSQIIVAKQLAERRKTCRTRKWKVSKR